MLGSEAPISQHLPLKDQQDQGTPALNASRMSTWPRQCSKICQGGAARPQVGSAAASGVGSAARPQRGSAAVHGVHYTAAPVPLCSHRCLWVLWKGNLKKKHQAPVR